MSSTVCMGYGCQQHRQRHERGGHVFKDKKPHSPRPIFEMKDASQLNNAYFTKFKRITLFVENRFICSLMIALAMLLLAVARCQGQARLNGSVVVNSDGSFKYAVFSISDSPAN